MTTTTTNNHSTRSTLETIGLGGGVSNAVGILLVVAGRLGSWKGFTPNDNDTSALGAIAVVLVLVGFLVTIGVAIALVVRQRRRGLSSTTKGLLGWLAVAVVITVLFAAGVFG